MRVELRKGIQRKIIKKNKLNNTWKSLAKILNIKERNLKSYYYEKSLIPLEVFKMLDKNRKYQKDILNIKNDNWGKSKGGKNSTGSTKEINFPEDSEELSEFYGIMLGDGNLTKIKDYKIGTYMIRIVGDSRNDKDYIENYVKPLIERLFKIKARIGKFKSNAIFVEAHGIKLVNFLEIKGFKSGNKIKNKLGIPRWIRKNNKFLISCLRGLYDTDGSVYKLTNQNSYQIDFCNKNIRLLKDVRIALIRLGITPSKISKQKDIYITKREEIAKFYKAVGFHNPKHFNKIKMWNIAPSSSGQISSVNSVED